MRSWAIAAVVVLLGAGCSAPEVNDDAARDDPTVSDTSSADPSVPAGSSYTFITATGTVVESGPEYRQAGVCGMSATVAQWDAASKDMWLSQQAVHWGHASSPLLMAASVQLVEMDPSHCAGGWSPVAAHNHSFALPYWWSQPPLRMEWDGTTWSVGGVALVPGAEATFPVTSTYPRDDRAPGAVYTYAGNVTFRNEGLWPHAKVHLVDGGWSQCCPPPEPEPPTPPEPQPLPYHVLKVKATVSRYPPAPSPTGPQPQAGACISFHNALAIDEANGTAYVHEGLHPIDPYATRLLVHEARGGRYGCSPDQAWVVASSETWRVVVGGGEFTFPVSNAWWVNGTYVSGRLLSSDAGKDRTLTLERSLESDGVRWTVVAEFALLGPWSMRDLHEVDANATLPPTSLWAAWRA